MTLALSRRHTLPDFGRLWTDAPAFMTTATLAALWVIPLLAAMALDDRLFQGENVWVKPVKFHAALTIYLATLAFYARYLPAGWSGGRTWRAFAMAVSFAVLAEMVWIGGAAAADTASHFNTTIPLMMVLYGLMGVFAVLLTSASLVMGVAIWRNPDSGLSPPLHLSVTMGLVLTFGLTVIVAGYMSGHGSHFVGVSTRTLPLMGWSRDAGDLRVAHFLATHALHAVPLVGLVGSRRVVIAAGVGYAALVIATFLQALLGAPFLPLLG